VAHVHVEHLEPGVILDDARRCLSVDLRDLELMPMQVERMRFVRPM
jgi:hypothetical protein